MVRNSCREDKVVGGCPGAQAETPKVFSNVRTPQNQRCNQQKQQLVPESLSRGLPAAKSSSGLGADDLFHMAVSGNFGLACSDLKTAHGKNLPCFVTSARWLFVAAKLVAA